MKILTINRFSFLPEGTFGVLKDGTSSGQPFALTGEPPWLLNRKDDPKTKENESSCIPLGKYLCKRIKSPKFGETFEICRVVGRSKILFHKGNVPIIDSHGCVLIGESFGMIDGKVGISHSGEGFIEFMGRLKEIQEFELYVF